ncbi:TonB C-terminal domain-containing protein [Sulfurimonas sp.]|nr:TonB C-terminal domain-containing protein [Sulfurimonas sp.]
MDRENSYFYLSGFISLSIFILVLFLILLSITPNRTTSFSLNKDDFIAVSINLTSKNFKQRYYDKNDVNIDNMFSDLWTQGVKKQKETPKNDNKRVLQQIEKKIKTVDKNSVKSVSDLFDTLDTSKSEDNTKKSTGNEVNEYLAKIQAIVYKHFFPPQNSQGNSVKSVIELNAIGKVIDFRILNYSANNALNNECDKIKSRLLNTVFPKNPDNVSGTYIITLTSKE